LGGAAFSTACFLRRSISLSLSLSAMVKCTSLLERRACWDVGQGAQRLRIRFMTILSIRFKAACSALVAGPRGLGLVLALGGTGSGGGFFDMPEHYHVWERPQEVGCGGAEGEGRRLTCQTARQAGAHHIFNRRFSNTA
jgi:hypothetical protein